MVESDRIFRTLQDAIYNSAEPYDLADYEIDLEPGSSLYQLHVLASALLNKLIAEPFIQQESRRVTGKPLPPAFVNSQGSLFIFGKDWEAITSVVHQNASAHATLKCLTDIAKQLGGLVASTNTAEIAQWMKFHDLNVPTSLERIINLKDFFDFKLPDVDALGNYWTQILSVHEGQAVLTIEQQASIRTLTKRFFPGNKRLLDKLYEDALNSPEVDWDQAGNLIKTLLAHPSSRTLAKRYVVELGWYGATPEEPMDNSDLDQLLITAVILDLNPDINEQSRSPFGTFELYNPDYVDLPAMLVRADLERYLVTNCGISWAAKSLAAHLLLANVAPEFLIQGLPASLTVGSIGWVTFSRTVGLIEAQAQGASRLMTYSQVMEYAAIDPVGPAQETLSGLAAITAIVDWALSNSVISLAQLQQSEAEASNTAVRQYSFFVEELNHAALVFSRPVPTRRVSALAHLQKFLPGCDFLETEMMAEVDPSIPHRPYSKDVPLNSFRVPLMSMVDLHMSGDLVKRGWNGVYLDLFKTYPALVSDLKRNPLNYLDPLYQYSVQLNKALATNVKLALAKLDEADQKKLQQSELTFYTVRSPATVHIENAQTQNSEFYSYQSDAKETQELIDAAAGHYGVVMCARYLGETTCYELLPLHGACVKNNALWRFINVPELRNAAPRTAFRGDIKAHREPVSTRNLPLNIRNYTHGSEWAPAGNSAVILDKLGVIPAPVMSVEFKKGIYQRFDYRHFADIAEFLALHRPFATFAELKVLAYEPTKLEKLISESTRDREFVLNLLVPFRACIQDLRSGESTRIVRGVIGCIMDAITVIGGVVGSASKITGIMMRTASSSAKVASIAKELLLLSVATFNPLDGLKTYASLGGKLLLKGGMRLSSTGLHTLKSANKQIHTLTGTADSYDLVKASKRTDLAQGTWIPKDSSATAIVWACRSRTNQWHAVNRFGRPWGEQLKNFRNLGEIRLPRLDKQLPVSYTRAILENVLAAGRKKIDAAVRVLSETTPNISVRQLCTLLLGNSGVEAAYNILMAEKSYFGAVSMRDFVLDETDKDQDVITLDFSEFQAWKTAGQFKSQTPFIHVLCADFNDRFRDNRLNEGVLADDLLRSVFHAGDGIVDLSVAQPMPTTDSRFQQWDVAPLMNLAGGHHPIADEGFPTRYHRPDDALKNTDSWTMLTTLLSQLETDPTTFARNLSTMAAALELYGKGRIAQRVPIHLNRI